MANEPRADPKAILREVAGERELAGERLLPLVYDELRRLARQRLSALPPGRTLQATALVHEAWLKLVGEQDPGWNHRGHFFGAAAQAMRDILVDHERGRRALKRGGDRMRIEVSQELSAPGAPAADDLLELDAALHRLEQDRPRHHQVVMLRHFAGLTVPETAEALGISPATVDRDWSFARAWLHRALAEEDAT
jgi:RNA polymerase sigma factor (TIGR02999 family)